MEVREGKHTVTIADSPEPIPAKGPEPLQASDSPLYSFRISCATKASPSKMLWEKSVRQGTQELPPSIIIVEETDTLFLGADEAVFALSLSSGKLKTTHKLSSQFQTFSTGPGLVLAMAEVELVGLSTAGQVKWYTTFADYTDMLSDVEVKGKNLKVTDFNGETYPVDPSSGKILRK